MTNYPKHILIHGLLNGLEYELTGNDRYAVTSLVDPKPLDLIYNISETDPGALVFNPNMKLSIERVRVTPVGAPGLQGPDTGDVACEIGLVQGQKSGSDIVVDTTVSRKLIDIYRYDEWQEVGFDINFKSDNCILGLAAGSMVQCDDFNIQDDYVGEMVRFAFDFEGKLYTGA